MYTWQVIRKTTSQNSVIVGLTTKLKLSCFVSYYVRMQLMMYIGNDLIESIQLEVTRIPIPGYVGQFKRNLKTKYRELILQYATPPEFLVSNLLPTVHMKDKVAATR